MTANHAINADGLGQRAYGTSPKPAGYGERLDDMKTFVALLLLFFTAGSSAEETVVVGTYSAVTESESSADLVLDKSGNVKLEVKVWDPGKYNEAEVQIYEGRWVSDGNLITLRFPQGTVKATFDPLLSIEELGQKGTAPGVTVIAASVEASMLFQRKLWLASELRKLKWP